MSVAAVAALVAVTAATAFIAVATGPRSCRWPGLKDPRDDAAAAAFQTGPTPAPGPTSAGLATGPTSGAVGAERRSQDRQLAGRVDRPALAPATAAGAPAAATFARSTTGTRVGPVPAAAVAALRPLPGAATTAAIAALAALAARPPGTAAATGATLGGVALEDRAHDHERALAVDRAALAVATVASLSPLPALAGLAAFAAGAAVSAVASDLGRRLVGTGAALATTPP